MRYCALFVACLLVVSVGTSAIASEVCYQAEVDVVYAVRATQEDTQIDVDVIQTRHSSYATAAKDFIERVYPVVTSENAFQKILDSLTDEDRTLMYFPGEWYSDRLSKSYYEIRTLEEWQELLRALDEAKLLRLIPGVFLHNYNLIGTRDSETWPDSANAGIQQANSVVPGTVVIWQEAAIGQYRKLGKLRVGGLANAQVVRDMDEFSSLEAEEGIRATIDSL